LQSQERQRRFREKNQENPERRQKEKERSEKNHQEKSIEIEILKRERTEMEKWKSNYLKLKEQFTSVEMQSEGIDIASLSSIPPLSEGVKQSSFNEVVGQDEKMFVTLLGIDHSNFNDLLEEVRT
jgi:hypothetical protein